MNASPPPAAVRAAPLQELTSFVYGAALIYLLGGGRPASLVHHAVPRRGAHQGRRPLHAARPSRCCRASDSRSSSPPRKARPAKSSRSPTKAYVTYKDPDTGLTSLREAVLHQNDMDDESSSDILKDDGVAE